MKSRILDLIEAMIKANLNLREIFKERKIKLPLNKFIIKGNKLIFLVIL